MIFIPIMFWVWMSAQQQPKCYDRPSTYDCNTETVCKDQFGNESVIATTAVYCPYVPVMQDAKPVETVNGRPVPEGCRVEHLVTAEGTSINVQLCGYNSEIRKVGGAARESEGAK